MADNPISSFPIAELLKALGARPGNRKDTFHSPFRVDKDASLHINPDQNVWYDHGVGGGNIDLVMRCKEIVLRGKKFGKTYDHIAFPNNVGGYALKSPSGFKCTTKGGITTIDMTGTFTEEPSTGTVTLFEGFFDFLSWLAKDNRELPTTDICVLNSVSNLGRSLSYLKKHTTIICCLDNDAAGREALETLRNYKHELRNPAVVDGSLFYYGYKDVNEWWSERSR